MKRREVTLLVAGLICLFVGCSATDDGLQEGRWVGRVIHPSGNYLDVTYDVVQRTDSVAMTMDVNDYGAFPIWDVQVYGDSLQFIWRPSFALNCKLLLQDDDIYQGACLDPWGGFGAIFMAPPGQDTSALVLNPEVVLQAAGRNADGSVAQTEPEPEPEANGRQAVRLLDPVSFPPSQAVDIGGRQLNMRVMGEGPVTVVLEAGLGDDLRIWEQVQPEVAQFAKVIAYDRAGLGYSSTHYGARTPAQVAEDLEALLMATDVTGPLVLVGHGIGGLYIREHAAAMANQVQGLVLVEATHESWGQELARLDRDSWSTYQRNMRQLHQISGRSVLAEYEAYTQILEDEAPLAPMPVDKPLVVLTSLRERETPQWVGETPEGLAAKRRLHAAWASASVEGAHYITTESSGYIHLEAPELVVQAIHEVVETVGAGG